MVSSYSKLIYVCVCDNCKCKESVEAVSSKNIYNKAQAVRSIGWSFGRDGKTTYCNYCRYDNYRNKSKKVCG